MKTFLRKLKLSLFAMLCGWFACNIAFWVASIPFIILRPEIVITSMGSSLIYGLFGWSIGIGGMSGLVILSTWLLIFLPIDLFVRETSQLRRPRTAALCGFFASLTVCVVFVVVSCIVDGVRSLQLALLPFALGTCTTGTVAAYIRAVMDKPKAKFSDCFAFVGNLCRSCPSEPGKT